MKNTFDLMERLGDDISYVLTSQKLLPVERSQSFAELLHEFKMYDGDRREIGREFVLTIIEYHLAIIARKEKRKVSKAVIHSLKEHMKTVEVFDDSLMTVYNSLVEHFPVLMIPEKASDYHQISFSTKAFALTPKYVAEQLDKTVIGNAALKKSLSIHLVKFKNQQFFDNQYKPQHLILTGPTGSGKTYIVEETAKALGIRLRVIDCSRITPAGYKGHNLSHALSDVVLSDAGDSVMVKTEHGLQYDSLTIVLLDEFDKLIYNGKDGYDAQGEFLKLLEGPSVTIDTQHSLRESIPWDVSNVMFIFAGAFSKTTKRNKSMGFGSQSASKGLTLDQLIAAGLLAELAGRIGRAISTEEIEDWRPVIRVKGGVNDYFNELFKSLNMVRVVTTKDEDKIIEIAKSKGTGLRGIRTAADEYFEEELFV